MSALRWALETAMTDGSTVDAVAAWTLPVTPVPAWSPAPLDDKGTLAAAFQRHLQESIAAVRAEIHGAPQVTLRVVPGFAAETLLRESESARCLVVGRRGHGGFLGLLLGSVADHCLHHAKRPLALVPPDLVRTDGAVVVGIDGSDTANTALRWGIDAAERLGRRVVALHAWSWLDQTMGFDPGYDEDAARHHAAGIVARAVGERAVEVVVVNDMPARALLDRSKHGDLVVVGSRGAGALAQMLVGSVSRQLAHHAAATVVVIRPEAASAA